MLVTKPMSDRVGGVLLAAGASRRVGRLKQSLDWGGQSILRYVTRTLLDAGLDPVCVVLGHERDRLAGQLDGLDVHIVNNPDYEAGMFSTVRRGLAALPADVACCVIALVDQPRIAPDIIRSLIDSHRVTSAAVTLPRHEGRTGHPIVVNREVIASALAALPTDTLRDVLAAFVSRTSHVDVDTDGILQDIDTLADYERERALWEGCPPQPQLWERRVGPIGSRRPATNPQRAGLGDSRNGSGPVESPWSLNG